MPPPTSPDPKPVNNAEQIRLDEVARGAQPWRCWGTYLSERQWGTVREDYSANGDAWDYFPHEHARSRAYRWGEDGIAGLCDEKENLCIGIALWNGKDAILKERLFGLTNAQGNHGEDVKELYYYLDATPTCSYARMLYKYPQAAFPYQQLLEENRRRGLNDPEFELMTPASSPRTITSMYSSNMRRPILTTCSCASPSIIAGPRRRRWSCCRRFGFATPGVGGAIRRSLRSHR